MAKRKKKSKKKEGFPSIMILKIRYVNLNVFNRKKNSILYSGSLQG